MTVLTETGKSITFTVDFPSETLQVTGGPKELIVTEISNISVGSSMTVKGYLIDPETLLPMTHLGIVYFTTSRIARIFP
ncbi:MAG: hypothetical protein IJ690_00610 [Clostridia bacterium]|nr:hypothetical protein [Clostridia bacterium]